MRIKWTPTQAAIVKLLSDGLPHTRDEIYALLPDVWNDLTVVKNHITRIRSRLPLTQTIVCELLNRRIAYRHVRLLCGTRKPCNSYRALVVR